MKFAKLFFVIMAVFVGISFYAASAAEWTDIVGKVTAEDGTPLCTMVLANGQHMFTQVSHPIIQDDGINFLFIYFFSCGINCFMLNTTIS